MTTTPVVHRWAELPIDAPMTTIERKRIIGEQCMVSRVELRQGTYVPTHRHENEQLAIIVAGRMRFGLGESDHPGNAAESVTLRANEVLLIPANAPHSAEALEDCVVLDVFSPPSEKTGIDRS